MKPILICLIALSINSTLLCQSNRDRLWFYSSVSAVNGQYTSVSPTYSADKYRLANFAGLKGQGFGSNSWFYFDFSGLYYWLTFSMQHNKGGTSTYPFAGQNVVSTTDRNHLLVQDRVGFEIIMTNFKKHENRGFGWQLSTRRFSLDNWGVDDGEYYILDRGPYNGDQSALAFGGHFNRFGAIGKHIDFRAGFYVNGLVSLNRVGVMAYPDLQVITHFGILGIVAKVSYEGSYLYAPTRGKEPGGKVENLDPAKNTGLVHGLHYEIGAGIDLNYLMKPLRRKNN